MAAPASGRSDCQDGPGPAVGELIIDSLLRPNQILTQSREAEAADPGPGVTDLARASGSRGTRRSRLEQMGLELDSDDPSYDDGGFPAESARRAQLDTRLGVCHFFVCHRNKTCI